MGCNLLAYSPLSNHRLVSFEFLLTPSVYWSSVSIVWGICRIGNFRKLAQKIPALLRGVVFSGRIIL